MAQLVAGSNLARGKIFTASIGSVDSLYPSVFIYCLNLHQLLILCSSKAMMFVKLYIYIYIYIYNMTLNLDVAYLLPVSICCRRNIKILPINNAMQHLGIIRKYHNHRLQTNTWHHKEDTQNTDSHNTIKVKQPAKFNWAPRTTPQNNQPTHREY